MKNFIILFAFSFSSLWANSFSPTYQSNLNYRTSFGQCPSKSVGELTIVMMREFEKNHSLLEVKEKILKEKWDEKYFLSDYKISYNPISKTVIMKFECPDPLVRVQIYKPDGKEHYSAILVSNGKLFDPSYEFLLRTEERLNHDLPSLVIPVKYLEGDVHQSITAFANEMKPDLRRQVSEMIVNDNKELMIIFSFHGRPTSVFLGPDLWSDKLHKLAKIVDHVRKSKTYPTTVNLTNAKKVVVKF